MLIIKSISPTRGLTYINQGDTYIVTSDVLGVVALSTKVTTCYDEGNRGIWLTLKVPSWASSWDLHGLIRRGVKRALLDCWEANEIHITLEVDKGQWDNLRCDVRLDVKEY